MKTKMKKFYCQDVAIENMSKDYVVIEMSANTYHWLKSQIHRLKLVSDGNQNFKNWNKQAEHALKLLELTEKRSESEWFTTKEGGK